MSGNGDGDRNKTDAPDMPENVSAIKQHWALRPIGLLAAVLSTKLFLYLVSLGISLPMALGDTSPVTAIWLGLLQSIAVMLVGGLFYWRVRTMQWKNGAATGPSWKMGIAFWVGIVLALGYYLGIWRYLLSYPAAGLVSLGYNLASNFTDALFIVLLFPVLERRYGILNGAMAAATSFVILSVFMALINIGSNFLIVTLQGNGEYSQYIGAGFVPSLVTGVFSAAAICVLSIALYSIASRRIPGTWMLLVSVPGMISLLHTAVRVALSKGLGGSEWLGVLCVEFPYYLLVFAAGLGILAGFVRWKTIGAFVGDVKMIIKKAKITQDDLNN
jgi:hypothetical protein